MARLKFGHGRASIEMDPEIERMILRVIDDGFPGVADAIEQTTDEIYQAALEKWPVKKGISKKALEQSLTTDADSIRGTVRNPAKDKHGFSYAYAIRTKQQDGDENVWALLVARPGKKAAEVLAEELGPVLARLAEGD